MCSNTHVTSACDVASEETASAADFSSPEESDDDSYAVMAVPHYVPVEDEGLPHLMGRPVEPTFSKRVVREKVRFSTEYEFFAEELDDSGLWNCLISPVIDKLDAASVSLNVKKTKRARRPRTITSTESPIENDRASTIAMFFIKRPSLLSQTSSGRHKRVGQQL